MSTPRRCFSAGPRSANKSGRFQGGGGAGVCVNGYERGHRGDRAAPIVHNPGRAPNDIQGSLDWIGLVLRDLSPAKDTTGLVAQVDHRVATGCLFSARKAGRGTYASREIAPRTGTPSRRWVVTSTISPRSASPEEH